MNTYPEKEIKKVNELLHKVLGTRGFKLFGRDFLGEQILTENRGSEIWTIGDEQTFSLLKNCTNEVFLKVYRILVFYYPRWIAYNIILESDDHYKEFSSNNELLIALTSIIDWLANVKNEKGGWTKRFISFLEKNLSKKEINRLINNFYIAKEQGKREKLKSLNELAEHIYKVRSLIVHNAELGGLYPYQTDFDFDFEKGKVSEPFQMITPKDFRLFLWKAIFKSLGFNIISETKSYIS